MTELWATSKCVVKDVSGVMGMISGRLSLVQSGDTLTLPVKKINSIVLHDETTTGGAKGPITSNNIVTITCTNDDYIDFIAMVEK